MLRNKLCSIVFAPDKQSSKRITALMPVNRKPTLMDRTIALRAEVRALREQLTRSSSTDNDEEIASAVAEAVASVGNFQGSGTDRAPRS